MSIIYSALTGEKINFEVIKINVKRRSFNVLVRMEYRPEDEGHSRISVLMNCSSTADLIYTFFPKTLEKIFMKLNDMYYDKFNVEFRPGWQKLYHETCGHMNLYIENLLSEETAVTYGIKIFSNRDRMDMLKSSEVADIGFKDSNSKYFNSTSVVKGKRRTEYHKMFRRANLKKFDTEEYDVEINI